MVDKLVNDLTTRLSGKIPDEYLETVLMAFRIELDKYDVSEKETSLVRYTGFIPDCYKAFMVTKKIEGKSDKTLELYKLYLESFFETMQMPLERITSNSIKVYLYNIKQVRRVSNSTLDGRRSVLSSFFGWAAAEQYIEKNPMATIKPIKYEHPERKPLNDAELEMVREACKDIREQAMLEFLYSTGCRVTEMERVNIADVDFGTLEVRLFGKGNKHRVSYLTAKAAILLHKYLETRNDDCEALFVHVRGKHERMKKAGIEKIISEIGDRAGVERLHPHLIRHTTATNALQHGMDVTQVQALLGHANLNTTMIYAKVDNSDVQRNHRRYIA